MKTLTTAAVTSLRRIALGEMHRPCTDMQEVAVEQLIAAGLVERLPHSGLLNLTPSGKAEYLARVGGAR